MCNLEVDLVDVEVLVDVDYDSNGGLFVLIYKGIEYVQRILTAGCATGLQNANRPETPESLQPTAIATRSSVWI